jgi:hypothetical protein
MGNPAPNQQVSWWDVHEYVTAVLEHAGPYPMLGTPEWCALQDDDPRKVAALLDAAQHWALRLETCQQAECEASHAVSAGADWATVGRRIRDHREFYAQHPWLKRVPA